MPPCRFLDVVSLEAFPDSGGEPLRRDGRGQPGTGTLTQYLFLDAKYIGPVVHLPQRVPPVVAYNPRLPRRDVAKHLFFSRPANSKIRGFLRKDLATAIIDTLDGLASLPSVPDS